MAYILMGRDRTKTPCKKTLLFISLLALSCCRTLPPVMEAENAGSANTTEIAVKDSPHLTTEKSVERVAIAIGDSSPELRNHLQAMASLPGPPLISKNQVRLLVDGSEAYPAMFAAIKNARDHVNLESYIFDDDSLGEKLAALLVLKQKEGVQVNVIYDGVGSVATPAAWFDELKNVGIRVFEFHPLSSEKLLEVNQRDHRKLLIVDGRIGFAGGINISGVNSRGARGSSPASLSTSDATSNPTSAPSRKRGWRDTQIEVRGPAVAELQRIFFQTWNLQEEAERAPQAGLAPNYFPPLQAAGDKFLRVIASTPDQKENLIYRDLLTAIRQSQRSVHLTMAYFSPDRQTILALKDAAARGVDVTLVLPGFSDIWLIFEAGRSHYTDLLSAGIKIYERHDALLHAKTAVIDGVWSTVGSSNMDMRSFLHNNEVNVIVLGSDFGDAMEVMFRRDVEAAEPVVLQRWRKRPLLQRCRETLGRLLAYWL